MLAIRDEHVTTELTEHLHKHGIRFQIGNPSDFYIDSVVYEALDGNEQSHTGEYANEAIDSVLDLISTGELTTRPFEQEVRDEITSILTTLAVDDRGELEELEELIGNVFNRGMEPTSTIDGISFYETPNFVITQDEYTNEFTYKHIEYGRLAESELRKIMRSII